MYQKVAFRTWLLLLLLILIGIQQSLAYAPPSADAPRIRLKTATFDPLAGRPDIPRGLRTEVVDGRPATYLVQFAGPVQEAWKAAVEQAGARPSTTTSPSTPSLLGWSRRRPRRCKAYPLSGGLVCTTQRTDWPPNCRN